MVFWSMKHRSSPMREMLSKVYEVDMSAAIQRKGKRKNNTRKMQRQNGVDVDEDEEEKKKADE